MLPIVGCTLTAEKKRREEKGDFAARVFLRHYLYFCYIQLKVALC